MGEPSIFEFPFLTDYKNTILIEMNEVIKELFP